MEEPWPPPPLPSVVPQSPAMVGSIGERKSHDQVRGDSPDMLRSCLTRAAAATLRPDDRACAEDSIASVDMSDLNALKSDNEGDGDDQASHLFPRFPHLPRSQAQIASDIASCAPSNVHEPRKPSKSSVCSIHVSTTSEDVTPRNGALSPEITQMISATPRPRKRSTPSRSREASSTRDRKDSRRGADVPPVPTGSQRMKRTRGKVARLSGGDEGICVSGEEVNDSDSSLDLHTPLP